MATTKKKANPIMVLVITGILFCFFLWICKNPSTSSTTLSEMDSLKNISRAYIWNNMNDRDSYEGGEWCQVIVRTDDGGKMIWHEFRGNNAFGAKVKAFKRFYFDPKNNITKVTDN